MARQTTPAARFAPAAFLATVALIAGCLAAVAAHVAIDFAGDFAVAHDTYDGVAHSSRAAMAVCAFALALLACLRYLWSAFHDAHFSADSLRALVRPALAMQAWRYAGAVALVTVVALVAMECFDALLAGSRVDDLADALGGSAVLGLAITLASAACFAAASLRVLRLLAAAHRKVVDAVCALLIGTRRRAAISCPLFVAVASSRLRAETSPLALRAAKRAPPRLFV